jgi:hypothetical protein
MTMIWNGQTFDNLKLFNSIIKKGLPQTHNFCNIVNNQTQLSDVMEENMKLGVRFEFGSTTY